MRGHVRKRGETWQYTVELDIDPSTGKRRQKSKGGFKTKKECEKVMNELIVEIESGQLFESEDMNLKSYLNYWFETYAKVNVAQSTFELYKGFSKTIIKYIGNLNLKELKKAKSSTKILLKAA